MPESASLLMLEFLNWISSRRRTHTETMEAWRSTCPRHTMWEDALADGLIQMEGSLHQSEVTLTDRGRTILKGNHQYKSTQTL
jgi:hypothetical protein